MSLLISICGLSPWGQARAASLETLLMPGKVTTVHAKIEAECGQCHDRANRPNQLNLCLDCHKPIAADIRDRRGLHGRRDNAADTQCSACHTEHLGRDGQIVNLMPQQFDHTRTDFQLEGGHRQVACASCHKPGKTFSEAPGRCVDCHKSVDPHEGKLGTDCAAQRRQAAAGRGDRQHANPGIPGRRLRHPGPDESPTNGAFIPTEQEFREREHGVWKGEGFSEIGKSENGP